MVDGSVGLFHAGYQLFSCNCSFFAPRYSFSHSADNAVNGCIFVIIYLCMNRKKASLQLRKGNWNEACNVEGYFG